jgi:NADH pyrophosphatase NudC (nudix superfamily)
MWRRLTPGSARQRHYSRTNNKCIPQILTRLTCRALTSLSIAIPSSRRRRGQRSKTLAPTAATDRALATTAATGDTRPPPHFSDLFLDRAAALRKDPERLQELASSPESLIIVCHQDRVLVSEPRGTAVPAISTSSSAASGPEAGSLAPPGTVNPELVAPAFFPAFFRPGHPVLAPESGAVDSDPGFIFLGLSPAGQAVFACQLARVPPGLGLPPPPARKGDGGGEALPEDRRTEGEWLFMWAAPRVDGQGMTGPDAAAIALAAALLKWNGSAAFCSVSGEKTVPRSGGHSRAPAAAGNSPTNTSTSSNGIPSTATSTTATTATSAGSRHGRPRPVYPRIDPAVIVAAASTDNAWLLLGRKASWETGRYSLLAGFTEIGETLESAALREVYEESGVCLDASTLRYHSSQPWPFPQSLMIGFVGRAHSMGTTTNKGRSGLEVLRPEGRRAAAEVGLLPDEAEALCDPDLPPAAADPEELEDARWFHRDWLLATLGPAGTLLPSRGPPMGRRWPAQSLCAAGIDTEGIAAGAAAGAAPFRIPGKYALANRIISDWMLESVATTAAVEAGTDRREPWTGDSLPTVSISHGTQKYVLLRVRGGHSGQHSRLIVRGDSRASYHNDILQVAKREIALADGGKGNLKVETVGGGRMEHYPAVDDIGTAVGGVVIVYGYSAAFGQAPHEVTATLLRRWLPFHDITFNYDGY